MPIGNNIYIHILCWKKNLFFLALTEKASLQLCFFTSQLGGEKSLHCGSDTKTLQDNNVIYCE